MQRDGLGVMSGLGHQLEMPLGARVANANRLANLFSATAIPVGARPRRSMLLLRLLAPHGPDRARTGTFSEVWQSPEA